MDSIDSAIKIVEQDTDQNIDRTEEDAIAATDDIEPELIGSADLYDHAGDIYYRCGDVIKAVEFWNKALERKPDDADVIKQKIKHRKIIDKNAP